MTHSIASNVKCSLESMLMHDNFDLNLSLCKGSQDVIYIVNCYLYGVHRE
jgi:hypothetical protein